MALFFWPHIRNTTHKLRNNLKRSNLNFEGKYIELNLVIYALSVQGAWVKNQVDC